VITRKRCRSTCRWSARLFDAIVFAENSASDITSLRQLVRSQGADGPVEFLSFNGLDHPAAYGRGYGEFKLVDHAMNPLAGPPRRCVHLEVHGPYKIRNIVDLVRARPAEADLYCHFRDFPQRSASCSCCRSPITASGP
jgi:hypothetical protein